ncbi:hypothetical protein pb186bvf_009758 [Paramecium bursaria]
MLTQIINRNQQNINRITIIKMPALIELHQLLNNLLISQLNIIIIMQQFHLQEVELNDFQFQWLDDFDHEEQNLYHYSQEQIYYEELYEQNFMNFDFIRGAYQRFRIIDLPGLYDYPFQEPLTTSEWQTIKEEANLRHETDSQCPICLESLHYRMEKLTILSCSHVFHKDCILNCEQLNMQKRCPMCRKDNYQQMEYTLNEKKQEIKTQKEIEIQSQSSQIKVQYTTQLMIRQDETITKAISTYLYKIKLRYFAIEQNYQSNGKVIFCCCY